MAPVQTGDRKKRSFWMVMLAAACLPAIGQADVMLTTTPGGTVVIGSGARLTDSATLTATFFAQGTITFFLFDPSNMKVDTETATASGNGTYSTPAGFLPSVAGTYQWFATYADPNVSVGPIGPENERVTGSSMVRNLPTAWSWAPLLPQRASSAA